MSNNEHPMKPSGWQLDRWELEARSSVDPALIHEPAICAGCFGVVHRKALCLAFAAGAAQELEACVKWLEKGPYGFSIAASAPDLADDLRAARRPKPQSLKEQALDELHISFDRGYLKEGAADTIRRALQQLPD